MNLEAKVLEANLHNTNFYFVVNYFLINLKFPIIDIYFEVFKSYIKNFGFYYSDLSY